VLIPDMRRVLHQFVASLTAAVFLLAGSYCACGGLEDSAGGEAHHGDQPALVHHHDNGDDDSDQSSHPCSDHNHSGCGCWNLVVDHSNPATSLSHLILAPLPMPFLTLSPLDSGLSSILLARLVSGDLTVPSSAPTLLRLHCALIV
jgi:hypothetical protein